MYRTYNLSKEKVSGFLVVYFVDYTNFNKSLRMQPLELNIDTDHRDEKRSLNYVTNK